MNFIAEGFFGGIDLLLAMDEETWSAVVVTLQLTAMSMLITLFIGVPLGALLGWSTFPGKGAVRVAVDTLLALPTVVVGLLVYAIISNRGPLGGMGLLFSLSGMVIGQTILALPIVIALTANAVEGLDHRLRMTLCTLGASGWRLAATCLLESRYAILAAAVTAYGRIIAEVGVSMMLGGNIKWHTRTITTAISLETGKGDFALGMALGTLLLTISLAVNALLSFLRRRADS